MNSGYQDSTIAWELVVHYRKAVLIGFVTLVNPFRNGYYAPLLIAVISGFALLQLVYRPYFNGSLNRMELCSQGVLLFTIYGGLCYQTNLPDEMDGVGRTSAFIRCLGGGILFLALLAAHLAFLGWFGRKLWLDLLYECWLSNSRLWFKIISLNRYSIDTFRDPDEKLSAEAEGEAEGSDPGDIDRKKASFNVLRSSFGLSDLLRSRTIFRSPLNASEASPFDLKRQLSMLIGRDKAEAPKTEEACISSVTSSSQR